MNLTGQHILIVAPHPDDEAIGCGGLVAAADGFARVTVFYLCIGPSPRQLVTGYTETKTRYGEIHKAVLGFGFNWGCLFSDEQLMLDSVAQVKMIDAIEDFVEEIEPSIVCLPFRNSYNQDHRAAFTAGMAALRPVPRSVRHFVPTVLEYEEPYSWAVGDGAFAPNFYLPLTPELLAKKLELLACHKSQVRDDPFPRSAENLTRLAKLRGAEIGIEAAEAYRLLRGQIG